METVDALTVATLSLDEDDFHQLEQVYFVNLSKHVELFLEESY